MIELPKPETKQEALFQGFVLLFQTGMKPYLSHPNMAKERDNLVKMLAAILEDPEITVEIAQACCERAVIVLTLEYKLHKKNTPKDHP